VSSVPGFVGNGTVVCKTFADAHFLRVGEGLFVFAAFTQKQGVGQKPWM